MQCKHGIHEYEARHISHVKPHMGHDFWHPKVNEEELYQERRAPHKGDKDNK